MKRSHQVHSWWLQRDFAQEVLRIESICAIEDCTPILLIDPNELADSVELASVWRTDAGEWKLFRSSKSYVGCLANRNVGSSHSVRRL